jgi:hypothetical protein
MASSFELADIGSASWFKPNALAPSISPARKSRRQVTGSAMKRARQQQSVTINRGLFLVRYAAAEDAARPPIVNIEADPASNKDIRFLLHPDHTKSQLLEPDTCLVVRALAPGRLSIEVVPTHKGGSAAATVRIEPLIQSKPTSPLAPATHQKSSADDLTGLRVLGHVTGIGDKVVKANEWLAGPSTPLRIEGISIAWPGKPNDLEVRYAVKTAKPQSTSGRAMSLGSFAGTRGKAMPVVGLMLEMTGPAAATLQFAVEAIFLGSPTTRVVGKRIVASGPTGREPLVGLRLVLENAPAAQRPAATSSVATPEQLHTKLSGPADELSQVKSLVPTAAKRLRTKSSAPVQAKPYAKAKSSTTKFRHTVGRVRVNRPKSSQPLMA